MSNYRVLFFKTYSGRTPISEFIISLDVATQSKINRLLMGLQYLGPKLTTPYSKQIAKNLYELRIRGKVEVRCLYSFHGKDIWVLHAFVKKTMKIPSKELKIAKQRQVNVRI